MTDPSGGRQRDWPARRLIASALITGEDDRILIVKPTYRDGWLLPGGVVESGETPAQACRREVAEELAIDVPLTRLLCVDYVPANDGAPDGAAFVFLAGKVDPATLSGIALPDGELSDFTFVDRESAMNQLIPPLARRLRLALDALDQARSAYGENGTEPLGNAATRTDIPA
jgi:ADP-ribose pyrophosphatase YjhB (NUDIX family)